MSKVQYNRAPCPGRIFEDLGNGFAIGCTGGTLFYFIKGKLLQALDRELFQFHMESLRNMLIKTI